jgi:hypothetical protein
VPLTNWLLNVAIVFFSSLVIYPHTIPIVNEKEEAAREKLELKRHRAERQKLKAMKRAIPDSDNGDEEEMNECPNTMVYIDFIYISVY